MELIHNKNTAEQVCCNITQTETRLGTRSPLFSFAHTTGLTGEGNRSDCNVANYSEQEW
jgi:hypothetical protein